MESVQDGASGGGATKLMKKPSGLSVARGTPAEEDGRLAATKNGHGLSHSASVPGSSASNGRGSSGNSSSLLLRRRRLKRNLSAGADSSPAVAAAARGANMSSALSSRSLDRKTLLKHRQSMQLQPADRDWVRADLHRGCVHVHDRLTHPRPVLCTTDTRAGEVALRLRELRKSSSVMRILTEHNGNCGVKYEYDDDDDDQATEDLSSHLTSLGSADLRGHPRDRLRLLLMENADGMQTQQEVDEKLFSPESESQDNITCSLSDLTSNMDTPIDEDSEHRNGLDGYGLNSGSDVESGAFDDLSSGARLSEHRDSLSDDMILGTEASILSPSFDSATEGHDMYISSSDELEGDCSMPGTAVDPVSHHHTNGITAATANYNMGHLNGVTKNVGAGSRLNTHSLPSSNSASSLSRLCSRDNLPGAQNPHSGRGDVKLDLPENQKREPSDSSPTLYVQLHGEAVRRLSPEERPLQIQNDFLFKLGFKDPWRVQEEGLNTEIGSLLRFYSGK